MTIGGEFRGLLSLQDNFSKPVEDAAARIAPPWAFYRPPPARRPRLRPLRYWLLRFPLELALALITSFVVRAAAVAAAAIGFDDRGRLHVRASFEGVVAGVLLGGLFLAFDLAIVYSFNRGLATGLASCWVGR